MRSYTPFLRYGATGLSFALVVWAFLTMPFGDRGYHFLPEAAAETKEEEVADEEGEPAHDLSRLRVLTRCVGYIRSYYVEPDRIAPREMLLGALEDVQQMLPPMLVEATRDANEVLTSVRVSLYEQKADFPLERVTDLYEMNWKLLDVFEFIEKNLRQKDRKADIEYAAINGMLRTLDPHSVMLDPDVYREMKLGTSGEFGGLGIVISVRDGHLTVVSVIEDTPAFRKGLKRGDRIVQIGEESTVNMPLNDAVNRLRGEPGTTVRVGVAREGWSEPKSFDIARENIAIRSVVSKPLGRGVGYVRIKHFQQNTYADLETELKKLRASGHWKGLILDLRDNPGGLLDQAVLVSDAFLGEGTIVTTVGAGSKLREEKKAVGEGTLADIPLVVLVNSGSASASEIVAGALKNNDRALVIGDRTFGKGSVQVLYDIDDAALKLTIAQYLTPGDESIQSVGIVPDVQTLPAVVRKGRVDLYTTDHDGGGERDLPKHLAQLRAHDVVRPAVLLKYLLEQPAEGEEKDEEELTAAPDVSDDDALDRDKTVGFAEALLTRVKDPDRKAMLRVAERLFADAVAEEDRAIRRALSALGVDWTPPPPAGPARAPRLRVEASVTPADHTPKGGEKVSLKLVVHNDGSTPVHRVHGISRSDFGTFDSLEFMFGLVPPGESREWIVEETLSKASLTRYDEVHVDLFSDEQPLDTTAVVPVSVEALPRPSFAFGVQVRDDEGGNGDGLLQRGERVGLRLTVRNVGAGPAFESLASIKNLSGEGVYIRQGRKSFEALPPGAEVVADFELEVKKGLAEDVVALEVNILDMTLRDYLKRRIELPVAAAGQPSEPVTMVGRVTGGPIPVFAAARADALRLGTLADGDVVNAERRAGGFLRVGIGADSEGWVAASAVVPLRAPTPPSLHFAAEPAFVPPVLAWSARSERLTHTDAATLEVSALAHFPAGSPGVPRFVYLYRNDSKIAFRESDPAEGAAVSLPLETVVALEPGVNRLTVFARIGDEAPVQRTLLVHRAGKAPLALGEIR